MKAYTPRYPSDSTQSEQITELKLKLKNECPVLLGEYVGKLERKAKKSIKGILGVTPKPPIFVKALADLHLEATYEKDGAVFVPAEPKNGWQAAKAFLAMKDSQVNPHPGRPMRSGSNASQTSASSSTSNVPSVKSVQWAETLAEVRVFSDDV